MKGSAINNIKVGANQKVVPCAACHEPMVVGKFAKKDQKCDKCKSIPKGAKDKAPKAVEPVRQVNQVRKLPSKPATPDTTSFGAMLNHLANKLEFEITDKRLWRKKYAIDGGGIATIYIMTEPGITGQQPKLGYFSLTIQRAIGLNDEFRRFMPPDAASDCELLAAELGGVEVHRPQIGQERCEMCGSVTDEFGVHGNKIYCVKPNNCFRKIFTSRGAEAEE